MKVKNNFYCDLSVDNCFMLDMNSCMSSPGNDSNLEEECSFTNGCERKESQQKMYRCNYSKCNIYFYRYWRLQDHVNRHKGIRSYQCKEESCSQAYFTWKNLCNHLTNIHKMKNLKKSEYISKTKCNTHKCSYEGCGAEFSRPWRLASHMCQHTGVKLYSCSEIGCSKAYTTIGCLRRHIANIHKPQPKIVKGYLCSEESCKRLYKTLGGLQKHYNLQHASKQQNVSIFRCSFCGKCFITSDLLAYHKTSHANNPPYKCIKEGCDKLYGCIESSKRHYNKHHANDQQTASSLKCLSPHMNSQEINVPYRCDKCNSHFSEIMAWNEHMVTHKMIVCQEKGCNPSPSQNSLLEEHKNLAPRQSFACKFCDKSFNRKSNLIVHQKKHLSCNEIKRFSCPYTDCTKCYTRKFSLDQHIKIRHLDKKLLCSYPGCKRRLVTTQKLQEHMKLHDPSYQPPIRKQIARRQRKDAGQPKRSMAVKLSGVKVSYTEEKRILSCDPQNQNLNNETSDSSDGESESCDGSSETCDEWSELSDVEEN